MPQENMLNFLGGMHASISPFVQTINQLTILDNCRIDYKLGAITKDTGYYRIGNAVLQANKSITGLYNFRQSASVQKMLATVNNSEDTALQLFYSTGGNWTELTDAETDWTGYEDAKVEMEGFDSYCYFVGYDATDGVWLPNRTLTGTTFGTTNTTNMPNAKYIKRYRDRLYVGNCYETSARPYRVYFSSVPSGGTISWTVASDFIAVDYSEEITGLGENWDRLIVFTEYSAYMYDQSSWKKVWDVGCSNHRTIKNAGAYMIWANRDGVWVSTGGRPQNIAGKVINFIRGATPTNFFAEIIDEQYWLYVGNVTVDGVSYSNCAVVFDIPTSTWFIREFYNNITIFNKYNSSGVLRLFMGDTVGTVWDKSKYTDSTIYNRDASTSTSAGQPIHSHFETAPTAFGDATLQKNIQSIIAFADRAQGLLLQSRVLDNNTRSITPYKKLGQLTKFENAFNVKVDKGSIVQFKGVEMGENPYWSFYGLIPIFQAESKIKRN